MTLDLCKPFAPVTPVGGSVAVEPTRERIRSPCGRFEADPLRCPTCGRPSSGIHVLSTTGQVYYFALIELDAFVAEVVASLHSFHELEGTQIILFKGGVEMKPWHKLAHYSVAGSDCIIFQVVTQRRSQQIQIMG